MIINNFNLYSSGKIRLLTELIAALSKKSDTTP